MAHFSVAAAFGKQTSQDYGFLVDQLDIYKNQLASDGKLTPGDYQLLIKEAQKAAGYSGLTPAQRSNIDVKISDYKSEIGKMQTQDYSDLSYLDRQIQDTESEILNSSFVDENGNEKPTVSSPAEFVNKQAAKITAKMSALSEKIDEYDSQGMDSSAMRNELVNSTKEWQDLTDALGEVENYKEGNPTGNYEIGAVFNKRGEIVDFKIARAGSLTGYTDTNALYGGLVIKAKGYGKDGVMIGNSSFKPVDNIVTGPNGPMKSTTLINESKILGNKAYSKAVSGYVPIDPETLRPQGAIPQGAFVDAGNNTYIQNVGNGKYKKFANYGEEDLINKFGITGGDIARMPQSFIKSITPNIVETDDKLTPPSITLPMSPVNTQTQVSPTSTPTSTPALEGGTSRTPSPVVRSPQTSQSIAGRAWDAAKGFLGNLFGK